MAKSDKKTKKRVIPEGYTQVNFNLRNDLHEKVVAKTVKDPNLTKSDVYNDAVEKYFKKKTN